MAQATRGAAAVVPPDKVALTSIQMQRLSGLTGVSAAELKGSVADLAQRFQWRIDPRWFLFERVCGQVVRTDPATGMSLPVPFATVHVMDTDCDFLGYFPFESPWAWGFPILCHQEEIATVVTDACGRFCVWIPRFDIEWVVRWRLEYICFPEIFRIPTLGDLLQTIGVGPGDPAVARTAALIGREAASQIVAARASARIGAPISSAAALVDRPAFLRPVPPPLSVTLRDVVANPHRLAGLTGSRKDRKRALDVGRYVGPFLRWRCELKAAEELVPILEVPDITFVVTQDIYGTGTQETIYSNGYFGVGWQSGPIDNVTLHTSQNARAITSCLIPPVGDCGQPAILYTGEMPVKQYIDGGGFGLRPNPPHADGQIRASVFPPAPSPDTPSNAPFTGTIQLFGCNQLANGQYYRLLHSTASGASVPFMFNWCLYPSHGVGPHQHVVPDANGWYPILTDPDAWFPTNLLLDWDTQGFDGPYAVTMEIGDASKNIIFTAPAVEIFVDNAAPAPVFTSLAWRPVGAANWASLDFTCPIVNRGANPPDIEFRVGYTAAMPHLRQATLGAESCGGVAMIEQPQTPDPFQHWYTDPNDNNVTAIGLFTLPHDAPSGAYSFVLSAASRAFNPSGGDPADPLAKDWYYDAASVNANYATLSVAVI